MHVSWHIYNVPLSGDTCVSINCLSIYFLLIELYTLNIKRLHVVALLIYSASNCGLGDCYFDTNRAVTEKNIFYTISAYFIQNINNLSFSQKKSMEYTDQN